jgi:MoxR-like ATPase
MQREHRNSRSEYLDRFSHPLLRIAAQSGDTPQAFRHFHRLLRRALDDDQSVQERVRYVRQVLRDLPRLGLPRETASSFLLEWLRTMAELLCNPALQQALALEELSAVEVSVQPGCWQRSTRGHLDFSVPYLLDTAVRRERSSTLQSSIACHVWGNGFDLVQQAVQGGTHRFWDAEECCCAVRLIVLASIIGEPSGAMMSAEVRFQRLEGTGIALWDAITEQVGALAERELACPPFWDGTVQRSVLLHLRGQIRTQKLTPGNCSVLSWLGEDSQAAAAPVSPGFARIATSPIAPGHNKEDKEVLQAYKDLRRPQPLALLPAAQKLEEIFGLLQGEYPWAPTLVEELRRALVTRSLLGVRELALAPTLLVGPPGSGKSRFVRRLANLLQLPYMPLSIGGTHDSKVLTGTSRGWSGGEPSPVIKFLMSHRTASAMVLLDEIDKVPSPSTNSAPISSVLLGLLEPETASRWRDNFLQATCDLSQVSFWATANCLSPIPKALLSRFTILHVPEPRECDRPNLVASIVEDIAREWRLPSGVLPVPASDATVNWGRTGRDLRRALMDYLHEWAREHRRPDRMH